MCVCLLHISLSLSLFSTSVAYFPQLIFPTFAFFFLFPSPSKKNTKSFNEKWLQATAVFSFGFSSDWKTKRRWRHASSSMTLSNFHWVCAVVRTLFFPNFYFQTISKTNTKFSFERRTKHKIFMSLDIIDKKKLKDYEIFISEWVVP